MLLRTPLDIGQAIKDRRRGLGWDQDELAQRVGASRKWLIEVEKGKPRAEVGLLLRALDVLGLRLSIDAETPRTAKATKAVPTVDIDSILDKRSMRK